MRELTNASNFNSLSVFCNNCNYNKHYTDWIVVQILIGDHHMMGHYWRLQKPGGHYAYSLQYPDGY